jgi:hypothetical protein
MRTSTRSTSVIGLFLFSLIGASHSRAQDLFDPVWATMTQDTGPDSPGCRGCHIAVEGKGYGQWFGNTQDEVRDYFLNGPGMDLVSGGRNSRLAEALGLIDGMEPFMPFGAPFNARFWADDPDLGLTELTDLGNWLDSLSAVRPAATAVSSL